MEEDIEKDANTMSHKDCSAIKGAKGVKFCADYNLAVDKANSAIKHCIHSSHHDNAEKTRCISAVVEQRDTDLEAVASAEKGKDLQSFTKK